MVKLLQESQCFTLFSRQRKQGNKSGRKIYVLSVKYNFSRDNFTDLRDLVDPLRNRGGKHATSWKFCHLREAEQLFTMLVLRWG